ncbi:MAG TPA: hypothetical protein VFV41_18485 [Streptosporangiaceae bacterium]|nr:hypothetical protein [Streptosporangiaceae bacterium]
MADSRECEQCGKVFLPRREHARFCGARCRVAWNREDASARPAPATVSALDWSITAMRDTTSRLLRARAVDRARAFAVVSEAVWWVTIVDAALVRYHPVPYDQVLAARPEEQREQIEGTLGGLRFVRNRMGYYLDPGDFVCPRNEAAAADSRITGWIWKSVPDPMLDLLPPSGQEWELTRYQAYQAWLAGHRVGEVFSTTAAFLRQAAAAAAQSEELAARA